MRFDIQVNGNEDGWGVTIRNHDSGVYLQNKDGERRQRLLSHRKEGNRRFPLPPAAEIAALPDAAPQKQYFYTSTEKTILTEALAALTNQELQQNGVELFGRYLFDTLLGAESWQQICAAAAGQSIELALTWPADEFIFNSMPWEAMHSGGGTAVGADTSHFLATTQRLTITRRVAEVDCPPPVIDSPPRVLFVVGSSIHDDVIRPGAEYIGLLRSLKERERVLYLNSQILLNANPRTLVEKIRTFRPDVVHFICHGEVEEGEAFIYMFDPDDIHQRIEINAARLASLLQADGAVPLPGIVVLNACTTGATTPLEAGRPFAADLVTHQVPIVLGMSGRVTDQACRLFTRGFYENLLQGGTIAAAAARGRRAALLYGAAYHPETIVDWALPVLFLPAGMAAPQIELHELPDVVKRQEIAEHFISKHDFPVFCGRMEFLQLYEQLMMGSRLSKNMPDWHATVQVLAIADVKPERSKDNPKYGRTWLLEELAAQGMRDGHIPLLLSKKSEAEFTDYPKSLHDYFNAIVDRACQKLVAWLMTIPQHADLEWSLKTVNKVFSLPPNSSKPDDLPANIYFNKQNPQDPETIAGAFRHDLLALLKAVRAQRPESERDQIRILLLIDDLHRIDMAGDLLKMLGDMGIHYGNGLDDIRAIITYSETAESGQTPAINEVKKFTDHNYVRPVLLREFHEPNLIWPAQQETKLSAEMVKALMVYKHFFLHWRQGQTNKPLAIKEPPVSHDVYQIFLTMLIKSVRGIPSNLKESPKLAIDIFHDSSQMDKLFEAADDDQVLKQLLHEPP